MTKQVINVGSAANDGSGTPARTAFQYVNANFSELYDFLTGTTNATTLPTALPIAKGGTGATSASDARTNLGLGSAATANTTSSSTDTTSGRLLKTGDFGIGATVIPLKWANTEVPNVSGVGAGFYRHGNNSCLLFKADNAIAWGCLLRMPHHANEGSPQFRRASIDGSGTLESNYQTFYTTINTTVDGNGFIKKASPIVQLYADKIELNDEAQQQNIEFEKLGVGDYLIKGSSGFAQEGWYIETPKDANGNLLVAVVYEQLENGDISVKTYKKKFDLETASIVADLTQPIDITENRWIDIRLQALPPIEYEMPTSKTPADFQPTGIAQAVSEMMNDPEQ